MADGVNAFTVYSSLELQINEFVQQLNRASQILDQTLQNMSGAVSSLNMPAVEVRTEANTGAVHDVENAVNGINVPPVTVHTETEPLEQVTVPPPDDRTFLQKIRDGFNNLKNTISSVPSNIAGKFREMGTNIVSTFRSFPSDVASKFREMKNSAVERIKSLPSDIAGVITSVPSKIGSGLKTIGTNISNAFKSGVENAKNALKELPEKASEALKETGEKLKGIAEKVAKAGTVAVGAVSAGIGAFTKSSLDSYAGYEQLIGGVETLFKDSADKIQEYADNAYKTSGLSANDYMETVTGFSASLLQSLGGDTAKSADIADMAVRDMSDNANKMGTAMENIQNAYQGFAKQNYTMLDNLKLGYGGTTKEMARLINDSGVLGDALIDLDDTQALSLHIEEAGGYATIIEAIHAVQTQMDITGTTAKEASSTIEGSVATMKSAWKNLTVEIAKDNGNIDELISYFVESAETALNNILPRIETIFSGIGKLIEKFVPLAVDKLPDIISTVLPSVISSATLIVAGIVSAITKSIPKLANSAVQLLKGFAENISKNAPTAIKGFSDMLKKVADWIKKNGKTLITAGISMVKSIAKGISENLPDMIGSVTEIISFIGKMISENLGNLLDSGLEILESIGQGIFDNLPIIVNSAINIIQTICTTLLTSENLEKLLSAGYEILITITGIITDNLPKLIEVATQIIDFLCTELLTGENITALIKTAVDILTALINAIVDNIDKILLATEQIIMAICNELLTAENLEKIIKTGAELLGKLIVGLCQIGGKLLGFAGMMFSEVKNALADIDWKQLGVAIVEGICSGMLDCDFVLDDYLDDFADNWLTGIKEIFGIHSPSKLMKDEIGKNLALGVSAGFDEYADEVERQISGVISDWTFTSWDGDLMDNLINGVKSKKKELSDTIKGVAENIKETFEKPVSVSTDITADGRFNRLKVPDISAVAENIYTVKSAPAESAMQKNSPVVVESLIINVEGKNLSSEYEMEKFINMVADRLQARNIIKSRGVGGVFS